MLLGTVVITITTLFAWLLMSLAGVALLCALRRARDELGRWPTAGEWEFATPEHVSRRSYTREFAGWRRASLTAARLKL